MNPWKWHFWGLGFAWDDWSRVDGYEKVIGRLWVAEDYKAAWLGAIFMGLCTIISLGNLILQRRLK